MGRGPAWRRALPDGTGRPGVAAAFLLGMAAAMLIRLIAAGGGTPESGGERAAPDAERMTPYVRTDAGDGGSQAAEKRDGGFGHGGGSGRDGWLHDGLNETAAGAKDGGYGKAVAPHRAEDRAIAGKADGGSGQAEARDEPLVRVYLSGEKRVETVPLETYVRGVVAGEMPANFETEALKAQAIAARTYIVRLLLAGRRDGGDGGRDYDVTDGEADQVYVPLDEMRRLELERQEEAARIGQAVDETRGLVLTYGGEPIQAAYFSASGGFTENAEDYWSEAVPYLRSVPSPWDAQLSPNFEQEIEMALDEFYDRLGIAKRDRKGGIEVLSRTAGRSVKEIRIGKRVLTGREVREALDLPSANFDLRISGGRITLICRGHGHGVGMSQWGAQALALAGNDAESILAWYYRGARIARVESLAAASESFKT